MTCDFVLLPVLAAGTLGYLLLSQGLNKRTMTTLLLSLGLATSQDVLAARNTGSLTKGLSGLQQLLAGWGVSGRVGQQQQQPQQPAVAASKTTLQVGSWVALRPCSHMWWHVPTCCRQGSTASATLPYMKQLASLRN
jgi:hypothetical protein